MGKRNKDEPPMSFYERRKQVFNPQSEIVHEVFVDVEEYQKVTKDTERGTRVLVARYPDFYKIYFSRYIPIGSDSYPRGGVIVYNFTDGQYQSFYFESVAIHPNQKTKYSFECSMETK
jgi:hypothetical protein